MPELPEVETIKRGLEKAIVGKTITEIDILLPKMFIGSKDDVVGKTVESIGRRAKILIVNLSGGKTLLFHFKLSGQIIWVSGAGKRITLGHPIPFVGVELPAKATHVIFYFDSGTLFFNDVRQFGWVKVIESRALLTNTELTKIGPEPLTFVSGETIPNEEFTKEYLFMIFSKSAKPIKILLMDQEKIAGIGNIYANEALFLAGIAPERKAKELSVLEVEKLREKILEVLEKGIEFGGSSGQDEAFVNAYGEPGRMQENFKVYQKTGNPCTNNCGGKIVRETLGGRGTFYCPRCQR